MKSLLRFSLLLIGSGSCYILNAQVPQSFTYQAIARDMNDHPLENQVIELRVSILAGGPDGEAVYSELHETSTNQWGLFTLEVGNPTTVLSGIFHSINWAMGVYFLKLEIDPAGGMSFQLMGISQLLTVPYALYADKVRDNDDADADPSNELQTITRNNNEVTLSQGGGSVNTGVPSYTQNEIDTLTPYNGLTVHNATTNCLNYYFMNNWYETCGNCTPQPTQPNAGSDTNVQGNSIVLSANSPDCGTGVWTIISGEGGIIETPDDPYSSFTGVTGTSYILTWTISTSCKSLTDSVIIYFSDCSPYFVDERDGQVYPAVLIGEQCWMAKNLNIGTVINGNSPQTNNAIIEKYCYNNTPQQCTVYGGLYQWNEMMNYNYNQSIQGICFNGWHIPTTGELSTLLDNLGGVGVAGGKMKSQGTNYWYPPNEGADNSSGFSALPGGIKSGSTFLDLGYKAIFWLFNFDETDASNFSLSTYYTFVSLSSSLKTHGCSVRCIKN